MILETTISLFFGEPHKESRRSTMLNLSIGERRVLFYPHGYAQIGR